MMMVEKDELGLGLSLSLSFSQNKIAAGSNNHLNNRSNNSSSSHPPLIMPFSFIRSSPSWAQTLPFSDGEAACREERKASFLKAGIDVNCSPEEMAAEDAGGACSPNSTISSSSGKRSTGEEDYCCGADGDRDRACSRGTSDIDDEDAADNNNSQNNSNKKLRLSKDQAAVLEETFKDHNTLNPKQKTSLAKRLGLRPRQVEVWFQNRRARTKLKQTEVDCEYLKRCCEALTDENRRLQKEVHQLRALKLAPQLYMPMPPTTLTMCPSCERTAKPIAPLAARPWVPARGPQNPHQL